MERHYLRRHGCGKPSLTFSAGYHRGGIMCNWLPELLRMESYGGQWEEYLDAVYRRYCADFLTRKAYFRNNPVSTKYHPAAEGKGSGFWHCISEGAPSGLEKDREPDLSRCERIGWIRAIIEHATDRSIQYWQNQRHGRGTEINHLLWFDGLYLVILSERPNYSTGKNYFLLKTAYTTPRPWKIKKLQRECDQWNRDT